MISNRIIKGIIDEFKSDFQFGNDDESKSYEKLVNYIVLSKHDPDAFSDAAVFDLIDVQKTGTDLFFWKPRSQSSVPPPISPAIGSL